MKFDNDINSVNDTNVEIQGIHIKGNVNSHACRCIALVLVYRPPRGNSEVACQRIKDFINGITDLDKKDLILFGDFNWDAGDDSSLGVTFIEDIVSEFGLVQLIRSTTRVGRSRESTIDLIFANTNNILSVGCLSYLSSDHYPIYMVKKRLQPSGDRTEIRKRKMSDYNLETFGHNLAALDWSTLDLLTDVNLMWDMIYRGLLFELDLMSLFVHIKVRKNRPVWFSGTLAVVARERDLLFARFRRGKKKNEELYALAVRKRREFGDLVKNAIKTFFNEQLTLHKGDQIKFWSNMQDLLGKKSQVPVERVFKHGTTELLNFQESADEINKFFALVGDRTASTLSDELFTQKDTPAVGIMEKFTPFTYGSLLDTLKELSPHKSSGIRDIATSVLFDAIGAVPEVFVTSCNRSLETGVFPGHCKVARIKVIPKKGDTRVIDNLRPISILSTIGKILEKQFKKDLVHYFESNSLIYDLQFGFRAGRSEIFLRVWYYHILSTVVVFLWVLIW